MIRGHTVGIVIPCRNEERGLASLLPRVPAGVDEVVVVDNGSSDRTADVARAHGVRVVSETVPGYGRSFVAGFAAARSDLLVTMDGDGQYPIADVPRLVNLLLDNQLDVLSGNRFPLRTATMSRLRQFGNWLLSAAARLLFRVRLTDTQSGMWLFWRRDLARIRPSHPSMPFSEEFKIRAVLAGLRVGETHIAYHEREGASTLRPFHHGWENLRFLLRLWWEVRRGRVRRGVRVAKEGARVR